jgi:hypothetical protein
MEDVRRMRTWLDFNPSGSKAVVETFPQTFGTFRSNRVVADDLLRLCVVGIDCLIGVFLFRFGGDSSTGGGKGRVSVRGGSGVYRVS